MSNLSSTQDAASRLASQSDAIGRLAQDSGGFAAVVAAFESKDADAFRWVLDRLEMLPYCELICEWVRIKFGVLRCQEVCGLPVEKVETPSLQQFARAIVQLASNDMLLRQVVDSVACGDGEEYRAAIAELKLNDFCYLLCHWVYSVIYHRVCHVVCSPDRLLLGDAVSEIQAAAKEISGLLRNEKALDAIGQAAATLNCETLQSTIDQFGIASQCRYICRLICSWRHVWVCRELCALRTPVLTGSYGIDEARNFALASRQLATQPRALADLVSAVQTRNAQAYSAIIGRFGLEPYCYQICAWVGSVTCHEFCICVCPPSELFPEFTKIGGYEYQTQIDSALPATGLTVGDTRAFFSTLRLNGILTQTLSGQPLEYSFWYQPITIASTTLMNPITAADTSIPVVSSAGFPAAPFNAVIGSAGGGYEIVTVNGVSGNTLTPVLRSQQGTTGAPAVAGALIITGAEAAGSWTQVPTSSIANTVIGQAEVFVPLPHPGHWEFPNVEVQPNLAEVPAPITAGFTLDGWIQVPQGSNISLNGNMINLDSTTLAAFTPADETGVSASNPVNHPLVTDLYFGLQMLVRQAGSSTTSPGGTCSVVAIDNTLYSKVNHHPDWDGGVVPVPPPGQYVVAMVDIKELQTENTTITAASNGKILPQATINVVSTGGFPSSGTIAVVTSAGTVPVSYTGTTPTSFTGCTGGTGTMSTGGFVNACADISQSLTVLFTASHPNLGPVSIRLDGPGGPYSFTLPTPLPETGDWYGIAVNDFVLSNLIPCAYLVTLSVLPLLTTGDLAFGPPIIDQIAFCKST
jgi:hypothetical protein